MRYLVVSCLVATSTLSGCNLYYESQAEDMVQRQMDAMVFVEGGEFMMGNPGGWSVRSDTIPAHRVIVDDFYIQKYEVTQGDFELFMAVTDYKPSDDRYGDMRGENSERFEATLPAVASWSDAQAFCEWLGKRADAKVRLPTEAEWEFAARSRGQMPRYATGSGEAVEDVTMAAKVEYSRYSPPSDKVALPKPPGAFPPNGLGLYDMSGNVGEWVSDNYSHDYYEKSPVDNPKGPVEGQRDIFEELPYRVLRGGNYKEFHGNTTVTRQKGSETLAAETRGFRCTMN
ncbi:formylglycine-generating enzyme family protein [Marinobacter subterrani]|uniref:Formylglycine-generating enzyme, required for sulfatase activity, contains SUMF1/FGE domain n=1 Tax=Marinobacter subterrani TaxID=1658765 RepID=A0A0J7J9F0_9GAMM|nr:SUMF1/EgtB/PvdO family nonheme iron enzyme [Marinobacter subterrani]KMQ75058.1 Formylglycine-generating enzyme, required for sulfatase activity, contains SUMF1/FGE domain [Marinobacter subterrani]